MILDFAGVMDKVPSLHSGNQDNDLEKSSKSQNLKSKI
ncbi:hypothetical protein Mic7113_0569 [Allocoleopsis franciscana PCC 7113]|uniref:Uncharacterized protein n=1 Tax=Allocoleopsis franciscana PCC 7113 TaxID=1173027 RepID=K9W7W8_9CYAN|nr:hypothetical protein Mic7113_0569 [Allocoleopsis franciscana PCC 7113]